MGAIRATQDNAVAISAAYEQEQGYKASNTVVFGINPADGNTITLNGTVFTYRDTPDVANDVQVGADVSASIDNLLTEALPAEATYTKSGTDGIVIEYGVIGVAGNDYTIACDFTSVPSNLVGGSDTPDGDWVDNTPSIDYKLPEIGTSAYYDGATEESTSTALKTNTPIAENDNVRLYNSTDGVVDGSLGTTTTTAAGTTDTHDVFGDGSAVATYQLGGNANDLGGNYDGTATDVTYDTGKYGQAGVFNGSSSKIEIADIGDSSAPRSASCWFYLTDGTTDSLTLVGDRNSNASRFMLGPNNVTGGGSSVDSDNAIVSWSIPPLNEWHHVSIVVHSDKSVDGYLDGVLKGTDNFKYNDDNFLELYIGHRDGYTTQFTGQIDQVRIFNRALTADEVNTLYNEQATKYTADISSLSLTQAPTKAYKDTSISVSTSTEANSGRCIAQDEILTKVSSTLTNYTGTNANSGMIQAGDSIQIDGTTDVVCSDVVESNLSTDSTNTHDIFQDGSAVATYQLDGNANDLGGNYDIDGSSATYQTGKYGDCLNNYKLPTPNWGLANSKEITLSLWGKASSSTGFCYLGNTGDAPIIAIYTNSLYWEGDGNQTAHLSFSNTLDDNNWHHIVLTINITSSEIKAYVDNTLDITSTDIANNTVIGDLANTDYGFLSNYQGDTQNSSIDQVRIFNRALTPTEVTTLYNEQVPLFQYDCTIPEQSTAPTSAKVLDRSTTTTEANDVYDDATGKFTKTYNKIEKQGRAFKYKIEADKDVEVSKVTIPMNKEG